MSAVLGAPVLPKLPFGDGSLFWNAARQQVELRHTVDGHRFVERASTLAEALAKRNERRCGNVETTRVRMPKEVAELLNEEAARRSMTSGALVDAMLTALRLLTPPT